MTRWQMLKEAVAEYRQARREERALRITAKLVAQMHPLWHASLFDEPFLLRVGARRLLQMTPRELAYEWSRQFGYGDPRRRERDIGLVTDIAEHYLAELSGTVASLERHEPQADAARHAEGLGRRAAARL